MKRSIKRFQKPQNDIQYIVEPATREELSPFAFFDAGTMLRKDDGLFIGMHPHSGIGIITYFEGGELQHEDSGANEKTIRSGGVQWINAGGGVWHQENYLKPSDAPDTWPLTIHQLWLQLPPNLEESEVAYQNVQPELLPISDNVKIIIGQYNGLTSPVKTPYDMTYLDIHLEAGGSFAFKTPENQTKGFIFPRTGSLNMDSNLPLNALAILEENEGELRIKANTDSQFVLVLSEPQNSAILSRGGSIHTNYEAMDRSFSRIKETGKALNYIRI